MTGARIVHDTLEAEGWEVEIADAQKVKGLAPLACKTDEIDSMVLAVLSHRDVVPAIWLPDPAAPGIGWGARVHDHRRDRHDRALLLTGEADRLHRALPPAFTSRAAPTAAKRFAPRGAALRLAA